MKVANTTKYRRTKESTLHDEKKNFISIIVLSNNLRGRKAAKIKYKTAMLLYRTIYILTFKQS